MEKREPNNLLIGTPARVRNACIGFAQYEAFPRDHEDRGCSGVYVSSNPSSGPLIHLAYFPVAEKLKREGRKEISQAETTEEMEDEEGNVYNRKTYEDLKKQGLI